VKTKKTRKKICRKEKSFNFAFQSTFKMNNESDYLDQLAEIRRMMEKSSRFISLSGFSGIIIGTYAIIAAWFARKILMVPDKASALILAVVAVGLLGISLVTAFYLTVRRTRKMNQPIWGPGPRQMVFALFPPLFAGGALAFILVLNGVYGLIAASLLIFYGLALISASRFSHHELLFMGWIQVCLGLMAALFPVYGLLIWAAGFGIVHIVYGAWMYFRYERQAKNPLP
jgi:hypothetical protein